MRLIRIILFLLLCLPTASTAIGSTDGNTDDQAYTLQVATFADRTAAVSLADRLSDAWVQEIAAEGRIFFRVNYKRFARRNEAVRAQWDLEDLGYKSFIQQLYT